MMWKIFRVSTFGKGGYSWLAISCNLRHDMSNCLKGYSSTVFMGEQLTKPWSILTETRSELALTGPTGQPSDGLKPLSFLLSSASWKADYFFVWIFPPWDLEKLQHTRVNILDLKILQVFFKNRGEILVFEKMLNFLSFLVLLYVSGHFKQKKNFEIFFPTDW